MSDHTGSPSSRIWTISNGLSALRIVLAVPVAILAADPWEYRWSILGFCFLAYISDLSDGYLARRLKQVSDLGKVIDPVADKVFVAALAVVLAIGGFIPFWFILLVVARDVLILAGGVMLKARKDILAQSNMTGKMAVVAIGLCLLLSLFRDQTGDTVFLTALFVAATLMTASLIHYGIRFHGSISRPKTTRGT